MSKSTDGERALRALTRLVRFVNHLQRQQLGCGPITVQQCHTLDALVDAPRSMSKLADEMALHQSTMTRIVERLEAKALVRRRHSAASRRVVDVEITTAGRQLHAQLRIVSLSVIEQVFGPMAASDKKVALRGLELITDLLDPRGEAMARLIAGGCTKGGEPGGGSAVTGRRGRVRRLGPAPAEMP